jgi:coproporphyrinogen III oxidase-like Fe-S oxidoreductase
VTSWIDRGLAQAEGAFVRLTPQGWLMLDQLAVELDQASSG